MSEIGVYTNTKTLRDKIKHAKDPGYYCWWVLSNIPKNLPDRVFFAAQGVWKGYFTIEKVDVVFDNMKIFLDEWHPIQKRIERSQFQGFTYNVPERVIG